MSKKYSQATASVNYHVTANVDGGWSARESSHMRSLKRFHSQKEAIEYATQLAKKGSSELYVHGRDGHIVERNTYYPSRQPPKG